MDQTWCVAFFSEWKCLWVPLRHRLVCSTVVWAQPVFGLDCIAFAQGFKEPPLWLSWQRICLQCGRPGFDPWVGKITWRRERLPTPVFWPGEVHELYSPCGRKASDTTKQLSLKEQYPRNQWMKEQEILFSEKKERKLFWFCLVDWKIH